jgi:hypothetical protein
LAFFFIAALFTAKAQQVSNVNFTEIYKNIATPSSPYFYPEMLARYEKNDTTLNPAQYKHLYYGYTKQPGYDPTGKDVRQKEFKQLIEQKAFEKALAVGRAGLRETPFNLNYVFGMHYACDNLGRKAEARQWLHKFERLMEAIETSGDGRTPATAYVVIALGDVQVYLESLGLTATDRKLQDRRTEKITLQQPNELNLKEIYFNVEKLGWGK